jgi:hypothetical protein
MTAYYQLIPTVFRVTLFLFYWLVIIQLPQRIPSPQLDPSWASALSYFTKHQFQFGTDIVFTFGPLGYLYTTFYSGFTSPETIILELALKAFIACQLVTVSVHGGRLFGTILFLCTTFLSHNMKDYLFHFSIVLALITVCRSNKQCWYAFASLFFLAAVSLIKFSFFVMSFIGLLSIMTFYTLTHRWKLLGFAIGAYITSTLVVWVSVGQSFTGIPNYLISSFQIATGYQKSMFFVGDTAPLLVGITILVLSIMVVIGLTIFSDKEPTRFVVAFLLAQAMLLSWRHGFLRAEFYHIIQFYLFSQLVLITAFAVQKPPVLIYRTCLSRVILVGLVLPFVGIGLGGHPYWSVLVQPTAWTNLKENFTVLSNFSGYRVDIEQRLLAAKARYALPKIKALVGQESVDIFGFEQGIALLNDFNYRPRPVFQSYSAYNSFLVQANQKFFLSVQAPRFVLLKLQSIDNRFPAADDSAALETILYHYEPVAAERGFLLLSRLKKDDIITPRRLVADRIAVLNEPVELPVSRSPIWIQINWDATWREQLQELVYQPSEVNIEITTQQGVKQMFRLIEPLARSGFLLSPVLFDSQDVLDSITGRPVSTVKSFALKASPYHFQHRFRYRIYALPEFPKLLTYPADSLRELRYWVFDRAPSDVASATRAGINVLGDSNVFVAPAPSEIVFDVPRFAQILEGSFGLRFLPSFFGKVVDQADFIVEFVAHDRKPLQLFHRRLIPEVNSGDRWTQAFSVALPKNNSGQIRLRAIIPPDGYKLGKTAYWTDINFK